jgi:hypothetical protein
VRILITNKERKKPKKKEEETYRRFRLNTIHPQHTLGFVLTDELSSELLSG